MSELDGACILFDLDGTLVDTAPDLINTLHHILTREGIPFPDEGLARIGISGGARHMLEISFQAAGIALAVSDLDRMFQGFLQHYARNIAVESAPFPGLVPALEQLITNGAKLGVCTNKTEHLSIALLKALSLDQFFGAIVGADSLPVRKPDPGHITGTIARLQGDAAQSVMVGDSATDIKAARAAGIPVIGVPFGYTDIPIAALNPDVVLEDYTDLPDVVVEVLTR